MPTEFGQDYNWEHAGTQLVTPPVSCVSLGCWCGVAAALNHLNLRDAAFPFDWNRTTMQGIMHFLQTGFTDFLYLPEVKPFPESKSSGGKMWQGPHHSIWHEDLSLADGREKYVRRISRFLQNPSSTLLFIRALNTNTEVVDGENLLRILSQLFPKSRVYLLLIADCQLEAKRFVVDSTEGRLFVHCIHHSKLGTAEYGNSYPVYHEAVRLAYKQSVGISEGDSMPLLRVRNCIELFPMLAPFFGGHPQEVPFTPTPLPAPKFPPSVSFPGLRLSWSPPPSGMNASMPMPFLNDPMKQLQQLQQMPQAQLLQPVFANCSEANTVHLAGADAIIEHATSPGNRPFWAPSQVLPGRNSSLTRMVEAQR